MKNKRGARAFPGRRPIRPRRPNALLWPDDLFGRCARLSVIGSSRLLVENHSGILELTETLIRLNTGCGPITVTGEALRLCDARPRSIIVTGYIDAIRLPREGSDCAP